MRRRRRRETPPIDVSVSSDPTEIQRIREAAAVAEAERPASSGLPRVTMSRLIALLDRVNLDDTDLPRQLAETTAEDRSRLRAMSAGDGGAKAGARANATLLLGQLGEPDAAARLAAILSASDAPALQAALAELVRNFRLARPLLADPAVAAAIDAAVTRPPASVFALKLRLLLDPLTPLPADTVPSVDAVRAATSDYDTGHVASTVLHQIVRRGRDPEARAAALVLLEPDAAMPPGKAASDVWVAARVAGAEALRPLETLAAGADLEAASEAAHALARLKGREVLPSLLPRLDDPKQRRRAADAIGLLFEGTADAAMTRRLTEVALAMTDSYGKAELALALVRISGPRAQAAAIGLASRLGGLERQRVLWTLAGLTLDDAVAAAMEAGLVAAPPDEEEWKRIDAEIWGPTDDATRLWTLLHQRKALLVFDVETSYPPRHERLLMAAAAATRGLLAPEAPVQTGSPEGIEQGQPAYRLSFVESGRAYEVSCRHSGDHYDSPAVLAAVHRALADKGREERFVANVGGQDALLLFGRPDAIHAFCERVFIPFPDWERNEQTINDLKARYAVGLP